MEKNAITIIVPCYNVEKCATTAINSLLKQTYKNLQIIAIDDCSTDNTHFVLKQLESLNKSKLKVYSNEKNMGLAYTRNKGIEFTTTQYVGFLDADDYVENNYYEELMKTITQENADIAISDIFLVNEGGRQVSPLQTGINLGREDIKEAVLDTDSSASACNKIFKKEVIAKFPFLEGKQNEDIAAVIPAVIHSNKIAYTNKVKYFYVQRYDSIQNSNFSEKRFDIFDSVRVALERIKDVENYEKYRTLILYHQILMLYAFVILPMKGFSNRQKYINLFISKQEELKISKDKKCIQKFLDGKNKLGKIYWYLAIKLLNTQSATLINILTSFSRLFIGKNVMNKTITFLDLLKEGKKQKNKKASKISITAVVPNYNYSDFLLQRVYSILYQTEKISELILLDDCSTDGSRKTIDEIVQKLEPYINVRKIYNETNSGTAFKQWQKGINEAKSDYVWIAEADDYCDKNMLKKLVKCIKKDKKISIAYVDTAFIDAKGKIILKSIKPEIDIRKTGHWDHSYITSGEDELQNYTFLNCTIANVSSSLIKKGNYDYIFETAGQYKQAGDWVFYANLMKTGDVAYVNKPYNYYRLHGSNVSSTMGKQEHLDEIKKIHNNMKELTAITNWHEKEFAKRYEFLKKAWKLDKAD